MQVNLQTAAQHADLMHKIEKLNLLQDTNQQLRKENSRLAAELKEFASKVGGSVCHFSYWRTCQTVKVQTFICGT